MTTKEKIKQEIDRLSDQELEKVYLYLTSLKQQKKAKSDIRSLHLKDKLDNQNIRSVAYE